MISSLLSLYLSTHSSRGICILCIDERNSSVKMQRNSDQSAGWTKTNKKGSGLDGLFFPLMVGPGYVLAVRLRIHSFCFCMIAFLLTLYCLEQFALTEISYIIIRLLQEYSSIESRDSEPWRESMQLTCINFGGCKVALTPRS